MRSFDAAVRELKEACQTRESQHLSELFEDAVYYADAAIHSGRLAEAQRWRLLARVADAVIHNEFDGDTSLLDAGQE